MRYTEEKMQEMEAEKELERKKELREAQFKFEQLQKMFDALQREHYDLQNSIKNLTAQLQEKDTYITKLRQDICTQKRINFRKRAEKIERIHIRIPPKLKADIFSKCNNVSGLITNFLSTYLYGHEWLKHLEMAEDIPPITDGGTG